MKIDLHVHTNASDGEFSPEEVIELSLRQNLDVIAITDHNSLSGIIDSEKIKVVPGIELSCDEKKLGFMEVHVLGLFIQETKKLKDFLIQRKKTRINPDIKKAIELIKQAKGIPILAHPGVYKEEDILELVDYFKKSGGLGIEVFYPYDKIYSVLEGKTDYLEKIILNLARKNSFIITGGSDFHGKSRNVQLGGKLTEEKEFKKLINIAKSS